MRRSLVISLVGIMVVAFGSLAAVIITDSRPVLGLDLRGGVSVVLRPDRKVDGGQLNQAVRIIRNRVDALGVAEPDINTQGSDIVISLPGVKDPDTALKLVGQTAELRFRPVLGTVPLEKSTTTTTAKGATTTTAKGATTTTAAGATTTTVAGATTTTVAGAATATTAPGATTTTTAAANDGSTIPSTSRADDDPAKQVILPQLDKSGSVQTRFVLGPTDVKGSVVKTAQAQAPQLGGEWVVNVSFTGDGGQKFLAISKKCVAKDAACPNGALAIVLDGVVQSAPTIQSSLVDNFDNKAQITGAFGEKEAKNLATVLRFGALPVQLTA